MDSNENRRKITDLVSRADSAMLTTMATDGTHVSRPMAVQESEFDGDLWFFTDTDSDKVRQIEANPQVNVSLANDKKNEWTSLSGAAVIVHDRQKIEELWSKPLETWFPDGTDTTGLALLKVEVGSAEYWDADNKAKQVLGMVKAIRKDDPDEFPVENRSVDL